MEDAVLCRDGELPRVYNVCSFKSFEFIFQSSLLIIAGTFKISKRKEKKFRKTVRE